METQKEWRGTHQLPSITMGKPPARETWQMVAQATIPTLYFR